MVTCEVLFRPFQCNSPLALIGVWRQCPHFQTLELGSSLADAASGLGAKNSTSASLVRARSTCKRKGGPRNESTRCDMGKDTVLPGDVEATQTSEGDIAPSSEGAGCDGGNAAARGRDSMNAKGQAMQSAATSKDGGPRHSPALACICRDARWPRRGRRHKRRERRRSRGSRQRESCSRT